jgi:hypothetical protein
VISYLIVAAVVLAVNLLPAFGPPTAAVLVFYRLARHLAPIPLVLIGAIAAATGRLVLARSFGHLRGRISLRQKANLEAAGKVLGQNRKRSTAGLAVFALSPVPSAQMFEAAGLIGVRLVPLTAAFFAGRLVSYSVYVAGAGAIQHTNAANLITSSFKSPWGIALQILLLIGLGLMTRINWARVYDRRHMNKRPDDPATGSK